MHTLVPSSWFYLLFIAVGVPYAAVRTAARTGGGAGASQIASRPHLYLQGLATQLLLGGIAWYAGWIQGLHVLGAFVLTPFDVAAGAITLSLMLGASVVSSAIRTPDERRRLWVMGFLPRDAREGAVYGVLNAVAAVAEELAYRGVAFTLLTMVTGSALAGACLSGVAFALAHYPQGSKSMAVIFGIALVKQLLVAVTGTLWIAIVAHFLHNAIVALRMAPRLRAIDASGAAAEFLPLPDSDGDTSP